MILIPDESGMSVIRKVKIPRHVTPADFFQKQMSRLDIILKVACW